jgi:hypothetical protein
MLPAGIPVLNRMEAALKRMMRNPRLIGLLAVCLTASLARAASVPMWDPLIQLDATPSARQRGPIFDSLGNAWVVIDNGVNLVAHQSNGNSGTWKPPHIIGPALPGRIFTVGVAVDRSGGFYVTWGTGQPSNGSYPLLWTRYSPATGWRAPQVIYTSPSEFSETFPSIDSTGRLVVVFNPDGIASIATDSSQTTWGPVQILAPPPRTSRVVLPSVAANNSGTRLALVYLVYPRGLRYAFFNSAAGRWSDAESIPGSETPLSPTTRRRTHSQWLWTKPAT